MPHWTAQLIEPPWSKEHSVFLRDTQHYNQAAQRDGSDKLERHKPLSFVAGHGRAAGTSGVEDEPHPETVKMYDPSPDWEKGLEDSSRIVTVRDVKNAVTKYA